MNAASLTEPVLPRPGERILDRYVVESMLASGGMGVVLQARHELLEERFAIKVLQPDMLGSSDVVQRFLREAQACVALRGEHSVRVFDVGRLPNGLPFMVMELLTGQDLRRELEQRGPLPVEEAATWALQACQSLAETHARGIVHRDIKPSNLFLSHQPDGRRVVKVIDFGISKVHREEQGAEDTELTRNAGLLGSPQYMSPEQVRSARQVDHRTDIWSLGAVLYESLVAIPPFAGDSVTSVSAMIAADSPTPLERLRPGLPEGLVEAVMRCLTKDREKRLQSVAELAALLEPYAIEAPSPSGRVSRLLTNQGPAPSVRYNERPSGDLDQGARTIGSASLPAQAAASRLKAQAKAALPIAQKMRSRRVALASVGVVLALAVSLWLGRSLPHQDEAPPSSSSEVLDVTARAAPADDARRQNVDAPRGQGEKPEGTEVSAKSEIVPNSARAVERSTPDRTARTNTARGSAAAHTDKTAEPASGTKLNDILSDRH